MDDSLDARGSSSMNNSKSGESDIQAKHDNDEAQVGDHKTGQPLTIVKSILKPSTTSQQSTTVTIMQRWWRNGNTSSNSGKKQQEILSSINASGATTSTATPAGRQAHLPIPATQPNVEKKVAAKKQITDSRSSDLVPIVDTAIIDSLLADPSDMKPSKISDDHQPRPVDNAPLQPQRLKKIATKTLLSQQYRPSTSAGIVNVTTKTAPAPTRTQLASSDSASRPPTEVTISTATRKIPAKKAIKAKHTMKTAVAKKKSGKTTTGRKGTRTVASAAATDNVTMLDNGQVWEGVPDDLVSFDVDWNKGWMKRAFMRRSGASVGSIDRYWYTPQKQYKLRSLKEVERFVRLCAENNNDEVLAFKKIKERTK
jgi:hypothetical protein